MSYLVLARKWRPQSFEQVLGQKHVTKTLQNAIIQDRLAHALLFSGPRGVGKTSVARILAKAINCEKGPLPSPCNKCGICREITSGASVDVQEIDGASNRGIDEIRQLREGIKFRPTRCRFRVYIIDEVHMLTKEAFNALLKTLEEPPPHVYFIFATTEPNKIPATIHSRCQHFEFRRLSVKELAQHLNQIVEAEGLGLDKKATVLLAREAKGGVRDSLSLLDQVSAYGAKTLEEVCEALGVVGTQVLQDLALSLLSGDLVASLRLVDEVYRYGMDIQGLGTELISFLRDMVLIKVLGPEGAMDLVDLGSEEVRELSVALSGIPKERLIQALDLMLKGQESVNRSMSPRLAFEMLIIRVAEASKVIGIDSIIQRLEDSVVDLLSKSEDQKYVEKGPGPRNKGFALYSTHDNGPNDTDSQSVDQKTGTKKQATSHSRAWDIESWQEFLSFLKGTKPVLANHLENCKDCTIEEGRLVVTCKPGMPWEMLQDPDSQRALKHHIRDYFGKEPEIKIVLDTSHEAGSDGNGLSTRDLKEDLIGQPLVQEALRVFQARIAEVIPINNRNASR